eukprot:2816039-Pleurochrysis_carterae.AAC.3
MRSLDVTRKHTHILLAYGPSGDGCDLPLVRAHRKTGTGVVARLREAHVRTTHVRSALRLIPPNSEERFTLMHLSRAQVKFNTWARCYCSLVPRTSLLVLVSTHFIRATSLPSPFRRRKTTCGHCQGVITTKVIQHPICVATRTTLDFTGPLAT